MINTHNLTETDLQEITRRIVAAAKPVKAILFGSRARLFVERRGRAIVATLHLRHLPHNLNERRRVAATAAGAETVYVGHVPR